MNSGTFTGRSLLGKVPLSQGLKRPTFTKPLTAAPYVASGPTLAYRSGSKVHHFRGSADAKKVMR